MKRKTLILASLIGTIFTGLVAVTSTLAWVCTTAFMKTEENPFEGTVQDKYYASGSGTSQDPFVITRPRHLYNLAWLQLLGFYNKNSGDDNHQFYFKLGANIDMGEYCAIPPIGTELNPFVGSFDGNGYVISNLKVSNDFNDYVIHPSAINNWTNTYKQPHILGFFGVIGEYPGGNKNSSYTSSVNKFVNTGITGANIKTVVLDSLVGVAAGYAVDSDLTDAQTTLKNVVVDNSTIDLPDTGNTTNYVYDNQNHYWTENISDYTLVGYTNNESDFVKASKSTYGINVDNNISFAATEEGNVAGWGGSINMLSMFNQLHDVWDTLNHSYAANPTVDPIKYYKNKEITINKDGTTTVNSETNATNNSMTSSTDNTVSSSSGTYNYFSTGKTDTENKKTSSYSFVVGDAGSSTETRFMCLTGGKTVEYKNGQSLKTNYYDSFVGKYIYVTVNGTKHYLTNNGTSGIQDTTTKADACVWNLDNGLLYTSINDVQYYLNRSNNTTLTLSSSAPSNISISYTESANRLTLLYNSTTYAIYYNGSAWRMVSGDLYYIIYNKTGTTYYMAAASSYNVTTTTNVNNAQHWLYDSSNQRFYYSSTNYLGYYNSTYPVQAYSDSRAFYTLGNGVIDGEGVLSCTYNGSTYYVRLNGTSYTATTTSGQATQMVVSLQSNFNFGSGGNGNVDYTEESETTSYIKKTKTETVGAPFEVQHTYFPLRSVDNNAGVPAETNTGYVVSGGNYSADEFGDIRVSSYAKSTYLPNGVDTVYTINANMAKETVSAANFKKFTESKASMKTVLDSSSNIYGLHFMNASIHYGGDNPVIAEKVVVNGDTHYNYELPTDCIDFNLKEKGFINFFAGTYYTGNDSCFCINEVIRNGNRISSIREILAVYEDVSDTAGLKSYVYKYGENSYSIPFKYVDGVKVKLDGSAYTEYSTQTSVPSGYTLAFNTARIKNSSVFSSNTNSAFYFEIPMNEGEYCLGSVSGHNGAYLMYLDIAANASQTNRTVFYEKFSYTESIYKYPSGVSLNDLPTNPSSTTIVITTTIDASDSACMMIITEATGDYTIDRSSSDVTLTRANANKAPPVFASDTIELIHEKNSSTPLTVSATSSDTYFVKQMEYYDYSIATDSLTVTRVTDYSTDGGTTYTRRITQTKYGGNTATGTPLSTYTYDPSKEIDERSNMRVYNHSDNGKRYTSDNLASTSYFAVPDNKLPANTTLVITFNLVQVGGSSYDETFTIVAVIDESLSASGVYYTYNGMSLIINPDSGTITIKILDYNGTFTLITVNTLTSSSASSTATTSITINGITITGTIGQVVTVEASAS